MQSDNTCRGRLLGRKRKELRRLTWEGSPQSKEEEGEQPPSRGLSKMKCKERAV